MAGSIATITKAATIVRTQDLIVWVAVQISTWITARSTKAWLTTMSSCVWRAMYGIVIPCTVLLRVVAFISSFSVICLSRLFGVTTPGAGPLIIFRACITVGVGSAWCRLLREKAAFPKATTPSLLSQ